MTIVLTLVLWSSTAIAPPLDAFEGEDDRAAVADRDGLVLGAPFEDEDCPAVLEKSGGPPGVAPLAGIARRADTSSRLSASLPRITSKGPRLRIRLRC